MDVGTVCLRLSDNVIISVRVRVYVSTINTCVKGLYAHIFCTCRHDRPTAR